MADFADLYPFASHYLDLDGHRYHYLDEGQGPVLLMLHGNPTWSFYYRELIKAFRDDFRVIVPDHLGCGLSDKPQDYPYRLETHVANLRRLLDYLGIDGYTLVCHDWGGPIGFGAAVEHPEQVERLIVFNTTCMVTRDYPLRILLCKIPGLGALAIRGLNAFARGAVLMACKNRQRMTGEVKLGYLLPYDSWANRVAVLRFVQDIPMGPAHPSYAFASQLEGRLGCLRDKPMLICWGKRDFCFDDAFLERWRQDFPAAEVNVFDDAGHYVVEDATGRIIPLMREFLLPT